MRIVKKIKKFPDDSVLNDFFRFTISCVKLEIIYKILLYNRNDLKIL
jgi:hypothetical protein